MGRKPQAKISRHAAAGVLCVLCAGRGSARKLAQVTPTGILYSSRVKDMADLAADDEAAELEAAAQVGGARWSGGWFAGAARGGAAAVLSAACAAPDRQQGMVVGGVQARNLIALSLGLLLLCTNTGRHPGVLRGPVLQSLCGRRAGLREV